MHSFVICLQRKPLPYHHVPHFGRPCGAQRSAERLPCSPEWLLAGIRSPLLGRLLGTCAGGKMIDGLRPLAGCMDREESCTDNSDLVANSLGSGGLEEGPCLTQPAPSILR